MILFGVSSSTLAEEYENLKAMVQLELEEDLFVMKDHEPFKAWFVNDAYYKWIKALIPSTNRKVNYSLKEIICQLNHF